MRTRAAVAVAAAVALLPAAFLSAQVPAGGEFQVNTYTTNEQWRPSVAACAAGTFVVTWESSEQDGWLSGVFGQRFDGAGSPLGTEFRINTTTVDSQYDTSVACDSAGNFVVAWQSEGQGGRPQGILAQRFDALGVPRSVEFEVSAWTTLGQQAPSVAMDAAGNFVVVWTRLLGDGSLDAVVGRRYDPSGAPRGGEFVVNAYTTNRQSAPAVASDPLGNFVVVWESFQQDASLTGVFGQRFDVSGVPRGSEFQVNTYAFYAQSRPAVAVDAAGGFVVAWDSRDQDGSGYGVSGQRYDATGAAMGGEFRVNDWTTDYQWAPSVASDAHGEFVVTWTSRGQDGSLEGVFARRYDADGLERGAEFRVNFHTTYTQALPAVASDPVGNLVVVWESVGQEGSGLGSLGIFAQRFGGLQPAALDVDAVASPVSDGNRVLEPGETFVRVVPSWRNLNGLAQTFDGSVLSFGGPGGAYAYYVSATPAYGTVANGATAPCSDCYGVSVPNGTRPVTHWDATFTERIVPDAMGQTKPWSIHVGESFGDVPKTSPFYRFVETLLHRGVTGGCAASSYCPSSPVTREQAAVFVLAGKEPAGYLPTACTTPVFGDVPVSSPFCRYIEELSRRGVVSGCGGGNYCPASPVTREQMPVFVLLTLDPAINPPACGTPVFADVPASSPFCRWIEELARRGVVGGCGGGNYCPADPVTREQMAVFISLTFGLTLYGP